MLKFKFFSLLRILLLTLCFSLVNTNGDILGGMKSFTKKENVQMANLSTNPLHLTSFKWQFNHLPMEMVILFAISQISHMIPLKEISELDSISRLAAGNSDILNKCICGRRASTIVWGLYGICVSSLCSTAQHAAIDQLQWTMAFKITRKTMSLPPRYY